MEVENGLTWKVITIGRTHFSLNHDWGRTGKYNAFGRGLETPSQYCNFFRSIFNDFSGKNDQMYAGTKPPSATGFWAIKFHFQVWKSSLVNILIKDSNIRMFPLHETFSRSLLACWPLSEVWWCNCHVQQGWAIMWSRMTCKLYGNWMSIGYRFR